MSVVWKRSVELLFADKSMKESTIVGTNEVDWRDVSLSLKKDARISGDKWSAVSTSNETENAG